MSEAEIERALFPSPAAETPRQWVAPAFAAVPQEPSRKGVTLQLLWEEYCAAHPTESYSYPQFCALYRDWRSRLKLSLRHVHKAGEKLFVDYCGPPVRSVIAPRVAGGRRRSSWPYWGVRITRSPRRPGRSPSLIGSAPTCGLLPSLGVSLSSWSRTMCPGT